MRREGYEIQVSQPQVIIKEENGQKMEPFEELTVDVPTTLTGAVIEKLGKRKGIMTDMQPSHGTTTRMIFEIPTRGLLGYRGEFIVDTKGEGIMSSRVTGFRPHAGVIEKRDTGSMISMITGKTAAFALENLQNRGVLYIDAATEVYEGMVVGNVSKGNDMAVNPVKGKQLTNMRASGTDDAIKLVPAWTLSIERGLEVMSEDEYLEVTPKNVRLRKQFLTENDRNKSKRK
jgi:GTP-binding protein